MTSFYEVSKDQYPYSTLHKAGCSNLNRARYSTYLDRERIGRYDTISTDWCSRCFPTKLEKNLAGYYQTVYSPAWYEFMAIQREQKDAVAKVAAQVRAARVIASLELALENANAEYVDSMTPRAVELLIEYRENMRNGVYTPAEVEVGR